MLFVAIVSNSCFENVFVAVRVLAHHKLRARFLGSKYVAKAGRCFNSVISLQIDELSNYDRTCTIILVSSFPFYNIFIAPVKLMTVSCPNPLLLLGHETPRKIAVCLLFCSHFVTEIENTKLLFTERSVALIFYCLGSRTRTMVSRNTVGSHSVCNFFIQNNDAQL